MPGNGKIIAVVLVTIVAFQVLLLRRLWGDNASTAKHQAIKRGDLAEQQLAELRNSTQRLKDLQRRLDLRLRDARKPPPEPDPETATLAAVSPDLSGPAGPSDSLEAWAGRIQDLAYAIARQRGAGVASGPAGVGNADMGVVFPSGHEDGACVAGKQASAAGAVAAVVTITFNRPDYLRRHLESLLAVHGRDPANVRKFPLHISQDGKVPRQDVADVAKSFGARGVRYLHHKEQDAPRRLLNPKENLAYYRIANHYKYVMRTMFDCFGYERLIILEDDMELAPDFFSLFEATAELLSRDPTLFCVSSWNDHGQARLVRDEGRLLRSDFFPGLGWMLGRSFWGEIRDDWPKAYWDDWMRLGKVRAGRQCLRPEVCRTYNFGAKGSSGGTYYRRYLKPIKLSAADVDWTKMDLSYLERTRYDTELNATLAAGVVVANPDEATTLSGDVILHYGSQEEYEAITGKLGMLREWKDGVPRGGYRGVVTVRWHSATLYIAPTAKFQQPLPASEQRIRIDATGAVIRRRTKPHL